MLPLIAFAVIGLAGWLLWTYERQKHHAARRAILRMARHIDILLWNGSAVYEPPAGMSQEQRAERLAAGYIRDAEAGKDDGDAPVR